MDLGLQDKSVIVTGGASNIGRGIVLAYAREGARITIADLDLTILGFPCNDFAGQGPRTDAEIKAFCDSNYHVTFPLFAKIEINSGVRHPLYAALIQKQPTTLAKEGSDFRALLASHGIKPAPEPNVLWNFEKFLVGRSGAVIGRFAPDVAPDEPMLIAGIEAALAEPA